MFMQQKSNWIKIYEKRKKKGSGYYQNVYSSTDFKSR